MKLGIGSDHAGYTLKEALSQSLCKFLSEDQLIDYGCSCVNQPVDYPVIAKALSLDVSNGKLDRGILICGSGIGVSMAANRIKGVRAALCHDLLSARLSRQHNDANVLCLGNWFVTPKMADEILNIWLNTPFEGQRHKERIDLLD